MTTTIDMQPFFANATNATLTPVVPQVNLFTGPTNTIDLYTQKGWVRKVRLKDGKYLLPETKRQASYASTHMTRLGFEVNKDGLKNAFLNSKRLIGVDSKKLNQEWDIFEEKMRKYFDDLDTFGKYKLQKYSL